MLTTTDFTESPSSQRNDEIHGQAKELLLTEIQFMPNLDFRTAEAEFEIMAREESLDLLISSTSRAPEELPAHLARLCETDLLSAEDERDLFRWMNYLKYRASSIRTSLSLANPDKLMIEKILGFQAKARQIRDHIVNANLRLVMSIVKKFVTPQLSFDDMLSDGIWSLVHCVDKFDYARGFRFSTYAYRSITRSSYRKVTDLQKESARYTNCVTEESGFDVEDERCSSSMNEKTWLTLRELLAGMMDQLDLREHFIVSGRYALGVHSKVRTFQSLADELKVSKERVRQIEQRAVGKLCKMAKKVDLDELVTPTCG